MAAANQPASNVRPADVREVLRRQIGDASRVLRGPDLSDAAIHHARKELKRARANLRLLRPAVGRKAYTRENAALRDASRPLSGARDAKVLVETVDGLLKAEKNPSRRALLSKVRALLEQQRLAAGVAVLASGHAGTSADSLDMAWHRVEDWRLARRPGGALERGMKRIYARARKAYAHAASEASAESLHEWRKHVKYLGAALDTLDGGEARVPAKLVEKLRRLAESLGHDHDLVVLHDELSKIHSRASHARTGIFAGIARRRARLQAEAMKSARSVFRRKPKAFVKHIASRKSEEDGDR